jgi:F0F1-type ATP synthase gamma subunit
LPLSQSYGLLQTLQEDHDSNKEYALIAIGGTGADFFKARGIDVSYELFIRIMVFLNHTHGLF